MTRICSTENRHEEGLQGDGRVTGISENVPPRLPIGIAEECLKLVVIFLLLNAAWEIAQLPLYTLWQDGTRGSIAYAIAHCTAGDLVIGAWVTAIAAFAARFGAAPMRKRSFVISFLVVGLGYTVFSEWLNVHVRKSWAYTDLMPLLPPLGTGFTPALQWIVVPPLTWAAAGNAARSRLSGCPLESGRNNS